MGNTKSTSSETSTPTPSPLENQFNQNLAGVVNPLLSQAGGVSSNMLNLVNQGAQAFTGGMPNVNTPLGKLFAGISPEMQSSMAQESLRQMGPQLGKAGLGTGGSGAAYQAKALGDIYRNSGQFNVQNLGNLMSSLFTGNIQTQTPINQQANILAGNLQGLRTTTRTGQTTSNPFMENFMGTMGKSAAGLVNPTNWAMAGAQGLGNMFSTNPFGYNTSTMSTPPPGYMLPFSRSTMGGGY